MMRMSIPSTLKCYPNEMLILSILKRAITKVRPFERNVGANLSVRPQFFYPVQKENL